jgi:hypothetical protein
MGRGVPAEERLVEDDADGPDIGLAVVLRPSEHFGSHVQRRSQHGLRKLLIGQ